MHGIWKDDFLYVSTHKSIECIIVQRSKESHDADAVHAIQVCGLFVFIQRNSCIQVIVLASFNSGPNWLTGVVEQYSCARRPRPIGHLKILNASKGKVWVIDTHERPFIIDVNYPGAPEVCIHEMIIYGRISCSGTWNG